MIIAVTFIVVYLAFHNAYTELARKATEPKDKTDEFRAKLKIYKARNFYKNFGTMFIFLILLWTYLRDNGTFRLNDILYLTYVSGIYWLINDLLIALNIGKKFYYTSYKNTEEEDFYLFFAKIMLIFTVVIIIF
jgi:hypothetical protein